VDWDYEPDFVEPREPDENDRARSRFLGLFPFDYAHFDGVEGHFIDREMDLCASRWDPEDDELIQLFRAALFLRTWRLGQRVPWPGQAAPPLALIMLLACQAAQAAWAGITARPSPPVPVIGAGDTSARILLAAPCAPPAPVIASAGATG